jgi:hypothetical protein
MGVAPHLQSTSSCLAGAEAISRFAAGGCGVSLTGSCMVFVSRSRQVGHMQLTRGRPVCKQVA